MGDTEDMASATAVDTPPLDTLVLATAVATPDLATEATPVLEVSTASVRLRLRLRPIPTTELDTPDSATTVATLDSATDTAVATDTSDKKVPIYKGFQDQRKSERLQLNA